MAIFGPKWPIFDHFWPKTAKTGFFRQNPKMSLPLHSEATTLCKKSEQSYERIFRSRTNERKNGRKRNHRSPTPVAGDQNMMPVPQKALSKKKIVVALLKENTISVNIYMVPRNFNFGLFFTLMPYILKISIFKNAFGTIFT